MSVDPRHALLSFADRIARAVLEALEGEAVDSVFVAGSAARGEVAAFAGAQRIEVYSDLDLFVIVRSPRDLEAIRRRARRAAAGVPREGDGYWIIPEPDVGVYSEDDFLSQKARPGTVEIAGSHVVLWGSSDTPKRAGKFIASEIDVTEALYLIENRLLELADLAERLPEDRTGVFRRHLRYARSKGGFDAVSAALIALGLFHPSRGERMKRLREGLAHGGLSGLLPAGAVACIERCYEDLSNLQKVLESDRANDPSFQHEVESLLLEVWNRVASRTSLLDTGGWDRLVDWRCKRGRWLGNSRELCVLARRMGLSRGRVLLGAGKLALLSPVDALRLSGTVETLLRQEENPGGFSSMVGALEKRYVAVVDGLTRAFGCETGPALQRGRRLHKEMA